MGELNITRFDADQIYRLNCSSKIDPKYGVEPRSRIFMTKVNPTRNSIFNKNNPYATSPAVKKNQKSGKSPNTVDLSRSPYTVDESEFRTFER